MSAEFLDSNVFVYLFDRADAHKCRIARHLIQATTEAGTGVVSFQVVQETLSVITRKLKTPVTSEDARDFLDRVMVPLWRISPSQRLYQRCLDFQARYRYGFYDALIIAAALDAGCTRLYSEDLHHGQRIEGLTIENPFRS